MFWVRKKQRSALALPFRVALAGARQRYQGLPFVVYLPDGEELRFGLGTPAWRVRLHSWRAAVDLALRGIPGLGAAHARVEVSIDGVDDAFSWLQRLAPGPGGGLLGGMLRRLPARPSPKRIA